MESPVSECSLGVVIGVLLGRRCQVVFYRFCKSSVTLSCPFPHRRQVMTLMTRIQKRIIALTQPLGGNRCPSNGISIQWPNDRNDRPTDSKDGRQLDRQIRKVLTSGASLPNGEHSERMILLYREKDKPKRERARETFTLQSLNRASMVTATLLAVFSRRAFRMNSQIDSLRVLM